MNGKHTPQGMLWWHAKAHSRHYRRCWYWLLGVLACSLLLPLGSAQVAQAQLVAATATPVPQVALGTTPDRCEPNDSLVAPCALQTELDQTDLNFFDNPLDVYSFLFKAGRVYVISAASDTGIDPALRVFLAGQTDTVVAANDDASAGSSTATVQVAVPADGWYLVEVANRAPGDMRGKTYRLSARSSMAGAAPAATANAVQPPGDILENNYDVPHAARIAWGVPYDLTLQCPDPNPNTCFAGDHDFLLVPVKKGVPFVALTYDLGPGTDSVVTLYAPDTAVLAAPDTISGWRPVMSNDDAAIGKTLRSQVMFTPTWDGDALLIIAESERRNPPMIPTALGPAGRYRLIVGSPDLNDVQSVLAAQSDLAPVATAAPVTSSNTGTTQSGSTMPSSGTAPRTTSVPVASAESVPTAQPTVAPNSSAPKPSSGIDAEEIIKESCTTGLAVVDREDAPFYSAANPTTEKRLLTTYPAGTEVMLIGSCYIGWVKAQPSTSVTPGWMFAPDLKLIETTAPQPASASDAQPVANPQAAAQAAPTSAATKAQAATKVLVVTRLPPAATPVPTAVPAQAVSVTVQVLDADKQGVAGVKVQIVSVYGVVLNDVVTGSDGSSTLTVAMQRGEVRRIQVPGAGITIPLDPAKATVTIILPRRSNR